MPRWPCSEHLHGVPEQSRVIDPRAAEVLRQQSRGASREAALRYASVVFPKSMSAAIDVFPCLDNIRMAVRVNG